ncbi:hypothetical protein Hneap_1828 [Halothiobacillus neapolitanus c2]|uniref:Uncharacterized protein n=1 Tax=Halothiobacillus neapolitanus (strain ATCC 23641 / DSM 15147 / CIP 104769 / NCIMB 8539 / c2) TaxID=555778 RepID=D0L1S7_HALNC|nr:hypothetical protein Hneap_1828 [Halothiobacillus neapolitanus c2]TDN65239.1 hypothetical protein C8D83_102311 [Halothiobacillus neapolitanus]
MGKLHRTQVILIVWVMDMRAATALVGFDRGWPKGSKTESIVGGMPSFLSVF